MGPACRNSKKRLSRSAGGIPTPVSETGWSSHASARPLHGFRTFTAFLDLLTHLVKEGRQERAEVLGVVLGGEFSRACEIRVEDGDRLALVGTGHQGRYSISDGICRRLTSAGGDKRE